VLIEALSLQEKLSEADFSSWKEVREMRLNMQRIWNENLELL
jgi:hypothetical protein